MLTRQKVVVGMSGGVDSSVAAALLLEQGFDVIGVFMKNWHDSSVTISDECPWIDDSHDALLVAEQLKIPFHVIDFSQEYKERIVDYMFREYESGRTPNPDVLCNREIKFDLFLNAARQLGASFMATGHYCRKAKTESGVYRLLAGKDQTKDQSYFLCQLNQEQLEMALFPVGELTKKQVREKAKILGLPNADKKDSQGLCFVGKVKLPVFLQQQLEVRKGNVVEIPQDSGAIANHYKNMGSSLEEVARGFKFHPGDGRVIGQHQGAHFFTIGQRKGLHIGGFKNPLFVVSTDTSLNIVYVGEGEQHPGLMRKALYIPARDAHWVRPDLKKISGETQDFQVRIRYRQRLSGAKLHFEEKGVYVVFEDMMKGITPGQFAAWYLGEELIGSGVISN